MLGIRWSSLVAVDVEIRAADATVDTKEEYTDEAAAQGTVEAAEEGDHKIINSSSPQANRHIQRQKRDQQEAVTTARETTTSVSGLNSPQTKRYSCLFKPRRGRTM